MNASAGPATSRADKAQANRRRMRAAALALFTDRGYASTSIQAIADEAGMAVQTLYFTFGTKSALLKEILHQFSSCVHLGCADTVQVLLV